MKWVMGFEDGIRSLTGSGGGRRGDGGGGGSDLLALLLVVADAAGLGLEVADLAEVEADSTRGEGVGLRAAAMLLEGGAEAADEGVEGTPGLAEGAGTGGRRAGEAEERAAGDVNLRLPELIQIAEELQHVRAAAPLEGERRPVVPQILPEGVPIPALLRLVPTRGCGGGGGGRGRRR
ncbi:hypothetical protein HPP92_020848 [Vanilla planifolia]|uniref:Uncharacterized protein n=1 Tax=Vanilla planifolia TaxID=51239 RepID=A0A835PUC5_VANPL|nr:hypothetical protein HPP92_020848 [Vanilla planifolia]